jgi:hypothetical protein
MVFDVMCGLLIVGFHSFKWTNDYKHLLHIYIYIYIKQGVMVHFKMFFHGCYAIGFVITN